MRKYAMPVDPRVLEEDFESQGLDAIPEIVARLKMIPEMKPQDSSLYEELLEKIAGLFFAVNHKRGISLKDREELLPVFKELDRLSEKFKSPSLTSVLYRGVYIPSSLGTPLTEAYGEDASGILPVKRSVKKILEGLAYGLRSWTPWDSEAKDYAWQGNYDSDKVIFRAYPDTYNSSLVLETDAVKKMSKHNKFDYNIFDGEEVILFLKNPKILNIKKEEDFWIVNLTK